MQLHYPDNPGNGEPYTKAQEYVSLYAELRQKGRLILA